VPESAYAGKQGRAGGGADDLLGRLFIPASQQEGPRGCAGRDENDAVPGRPRRAGAALPAAAVRRADAPRPAQRRAPGRRAGRAAARAAGRQGGAGAAARAGQGGRPWRAVSPTF